jgi:hypothetical protein
MSDILNDLLKLIGGVAAIGTASAAFAYAMFRIFTTKWIETRFSERLETFKHQQNQEIERLRFRINTMMDWNVKLHQREFDILPETWSLLNEAFYTIEPIAIGFQQYPNLDEMSADRLEEFLEKSPLTVVQKTELKSDSNKIQYYRAVKTMHDLNTAIDSYNQFHLLLAKNAIFIVEPIKTAFLALDQMLKEAIIEHQVQPQQFDKGVILNDKGKQLLKALEQGIQGRLWSSQDSKTKHQ